MNHDVNKIIVKPNIILISNNTYKFNNIIKVLVPSHVCTYQLRQGLTGVPYNGCK